MSEYGVTKAGFIRKPFKIIEKDIQQNARKLFGPNVDLSIYSPIGLFTSMLAWNSHVLWQELEDVYYANWLQTAEGVNLERVVSLGGVKREGPKHAIIQDVSFFGKENTNIPENFVIKTKEGIKFETMSSGTIRGIKCSCNIESDNRLIISDDNVNISQLSKNMDVYGEGVPDDTFIQNIDKDSNRIILNNSIDDGGNIKLIFDPKVKIHCKALKAGSIGAVGANTVTEIDEEKDGLKRVNNENPSFGALEKETDAALRKRYYTEGVENNGSSVDAISFALKKINSVKFAYVRENIELYEKNNMAPKSIECFVQGGSDQEIARTIFETKPAGISTCGQKTCEIKEGNDEYLISFSRPDFVKIGIELKLVLNSEWQSNPEDLITNIIKYIGGTDESEKEKKYYPSLDPGSTIYSWKIIASNISVIGIEEFECINIIKYSNTLGNNNIKEQSEKSIKLGVKEIPYTERELIKITTY
jgi:uncharacterized phage protein gp47/JayE